MGQSGILEEMGEERLEDIARFAFQLDENEFKAENYNWDNFIDKVFPDKDKQLAEAGIILILGGGGPTMSATAHAIAKKLKGRGFTSEQIGNVIRNTSELEMDRMLNKLQSIETEQDLQYYNSYIDKIRNELTEKGFEKDYIDANLNILENMYVKYAVNQGVSRKDIIEKLRLDVEGNTESGLDIKQDIERFYQNNPEIESNINEILEAYKNNQDKRVELGVVDKNLSQILKENGLDVDGYRHDIDVKEIRHIMKGHGENGIKLTDKSLPITDNDIRNIPYIIENYDYIELGRKSSNNNESIRYIKTFDDGTTYYVEEIRNKNKTLSAKTMWKNRGSSTQVESYKRLLSNQNLKGAATSKIIIENPNLNVKKNNVLEQNDNLNGNDIKNIFAIDINSVLNDIVELNNLKENINNDKEYQRKRKQENKDKYYSEKESKIIERIKNKIADWHNASNIDFITNKKGIVDLNDDKVKSIKNEIEALKKEKSNKQWERVEYIDSNGNKFYDLKQKVSNREYDKIEKDYKEKILQKDNEYNDYIFDNILKDYNKYFIYGSNGKGGSYSKYWLLYNKNNNKLLLLRNSNHYDFSNWKNKYELQDKIAEGKFNSDNWEKDSSLMGSGLKKKKNWGSKLENNYNGYAFFEINKNNLQHIFDVNNLYQNSQQQNNKPLAQIEFRDTQAVISLFENANKSSLIHEMGHYFLRLTSKLAETGNSLAKTELEAINNFLKKGSGDLKKVNVNPPADFVSSPLTKGGEKAEKDFTSSTLTKGGERVEKDFTSSTITNGGKVTFTREQEELFARSYEGYLRRGIAPSSKLKTIFDKFSQWLRDVYKSVKELNINLNQDVIDFFDSYLNTDIETDVEADYKLKQEQEKLQEEIDKEREVLYQQGLSEEEVENKINDKYKERLEKLEQKFKSSKKKSKDYDFKKYAANMELAKQQEKAEISKKRKKSAMEFFRNSLETTDSILKDIDENLYYRFQKFYAESSILDNENKKTIEDFENIFKSIYDKSKEDYYKLDSALKNRFTDVIQEILNKYNNTNDNNFYNNYLKVRELLDRLRDEAIEVGVDVGYIENYFPREVDSKYKDDFLETLRKDNESVYNDLMYNIQQLRKESNVFGADEEARFINNYLRGFIPRNLILLTANNNLRKPRELENITPELARFFVPSEVALKDYVENTQKDILKRRLFGIEDIETRDKRNKIKRLDKQLTDVIATSAGKIKANQNYKLEFEKKAAELNIKRFTYLLKNERINQQINWNNPKYTNERINFYIDTINELVDKKNNITKKLENLDKINENIVKNIRIKEIKQEIQALQEQIGVSETLENSIAKYVENIPNLTTEKQKLLKRVITAIMNPAITGTGSKFWGWSGSLLALNSVKNAVNQLPELANSMYKNGFIHTLEAITNKNDIDLKDIGVEDILQDITMNPAGFANKILKWTGLEAIDSFGKNTYLNSTLLKVKEDLRNNDVKTIKEIEKIFGNEAEQVQDDLKNSNMTRLAKEYLFIKLAEIQPLTLGSKTLTYLENGGTRWMYALKSYMIKQLDLIHNDIIREFKKGNKETAFKNLIKMQAFLLLVGGSKDLVMGMFFGYDDDDDFIDLIGDAIIDNIIGINIISRYTLERAGKKGLGIAIKDFLFGAPVFSLFDDIQKDMQNIIDGKMDFDRWRTLRYVPFGKDIKNVKKAVDDK